MTKPNNLIRIKPIYGYILLIFIFGLAPLQHVHSQGQLRPKHIVIAVSKRSLNEANWNLWLNFIEKKLPEVLYDQGRVLDGRALLEDTDYLSIVSYGLPAKELDFDTFVVSNLGGVRYSQGKSQHTDAINNLYSAIRTNERGFFDAKWPGLSFSNPLVLAHLKDTSKEISDTYIINFKIGYPPDIYQNRQADDHSFSPAEEQSFEYMRKKIHSEFNSLKNLEVKHLKNSINGVKRAEKTIHQMLSNYRFMGIDTIETKIGVQWDPNSRVALELYELEARNKPLLQIAQIIDAKLPKTILSEECGQFEERVSIPIREVRNGLWHSFLSEKMPLGEINLGEASSNFDVDILKDSLILPIQLSADVLREVEQVRLSLKLQPVSVFRDTLYTNIYCLENAWDYKDKQIMLDHISYVEPVSKLLYNQMGICNYLGYWVFVIIIYMLFITALLFVIYQLIKRRIRHRLNNPNF